MNDLTFGVPKRTRLSKDFNGGIPSMRVEKDKGPGSAKKISLNKAAYDLLAIEGVLEHVAVSFGEEKGDLRIVNSTNIEIAAKLSVTKGLPHSFSHSKTYAFMISFLSIDSNEDTVFEFKAEERSYPCIKIVIGEPKQIDLEDSIAEVVSESIPEEVSEIATPSSEVEVTGDADMSHDSEHIASLDPTLLTPGEENQEESLNEDQVNPLAGQSFATWGDAATNTPEATEVTESTDTPS